MTERACLPPPASRSDGFTLIEVLVAMVILAVGLLGLEALGIGAARATARSEVQTSYAFRASEDLELALRQLRAGQVPGQKCNTLEQGDRLSRQVDLSVPNRPRVVVTILPGATRSPRPAPFSVEGFAYVPAGISGTPSGSACS